MIAVGLVILCIKSTIVGLVNVGTDVPIVGDVHGCSGHSRSGKI